MFGAPESSCWPKKCPKSALHFSEHPEFVGLVVFQNSARTSTESAMNFLRAVPRCKWSETWRIQRLQAPWGPWGGSNYPVEYHILVGWTSSIIQPYQLWQLWRHGVHQGFDPWPWPWSICVNMFRCKSSQNYGVIWGIPVLRDNELMVTEMDPCYATNREILHAHLILLWRYFT